VQCEGSHPQIGPSASDTLRVLLVAANSSFGGAERHVVDLANGLSERGHQVRCLVPARLGFRALINSGVKLYEIEGLRSLRRFVLALTDLVRRANPDIVHLHSPRASVAGRLTLRVLNPTWRPAVVSTAHGWIPKRLPLRRLIEASYLWTTGLDDVTIAVSQDTARHFGQPGFVKIIPNGIRRPPKLAPYPALLSTGPLRLGVLGRLTPEKGLPIALEAYEQVAACTTIRKLELHVYGDGPLLSHLKRLVAARAITGVHFRGWIDLKDVPRVLATLTALLVTSREEGFPYVVLEAMATGCPVICTAVGGIPEVVRNGQTGWLVQPNDPMAVARAILQLIRNPSQAIRVRTNAWHELRGYTIERMVSAVEAAYVTALERRSRLFRDTCRYTFGT